MLHLNFSALETALLPYFLFVVYGSILLWVRSVRQNPLLGGEIESPDSIGVDHASGADRTAVSVIDYGELDVKDYVLSVPSPWEDDLMATEFDLEVRCRSSVPMTDEQALAYIRIPRADEYTDVELEAKEQKTRRRASKSLSELIGVEFYLEPINEG
jgi:hypothetical protein